jgi:Protein of unknown function (DUF1822)
MFKILLDTDLVLVAYLNQGEWLEEVKKLWEMMELRKIQVYITEVGLDNVRLVVSKVNPEFADQVVFDIQEVMETLPIDDVLWKQARLLNFLDFNSALEVVCAIANNLGAIVTLKPHDFNNSTLTVLSLSSLLKRQDLESLAFPLKSHTEIVSSDIKLKTAASELTQKVVNLSQWLQNNSIEGVLTGWEEYTDYFTTINFRSASMEAETEGVVRAKQFDLGEYSIILTVHVTIDANSTNIVLRVYPQQMYLPENLYLILLDEYENIFLEVCSRQRDNWIELNFLADIEDKFRIKIAWNDIIYVEHFQVS